MPNVGPVELIIVLIIALVVFGPKRLPEMGRSIGRGIREFRSSVSGEDSDDDPEDRPRISSSREDAGPDRRADEDDDRPLEGEVVAEKRS